MIVAIRKQWRFWLTAFLMSALFVVLVVRVSMLQMFDVDGSVTFLQGQGDARTVRTETVAANRGMITDRHGQPLAVSTPVVTIWANPQELDLSSPGLAKVASLTGYSHAELQKRLKHYKGKQFVYLKRQMSPDVAKKILALKVRGIHGEEEYRRFYPAGETAAHLTGFTDIENNGQEGLELGFDNWLQGHNGKNKVVKDLYGRTIKTLSQIEEAKPGQDVALSIDLRLQHVAYRALKKAVLHQRAHSGSAVVLDARTGEVLAMVNQPSFNPNNRSTMAASSVRNRAITDVFEPGSTVKPFTVVAALESGKFTPDTIIDTSPGYIRLNGKTLLDPVNYGKLDVTHVIVKSSQIGTTKIALQLKQSQVHDVFYRVGFGQFIGVGFPGENTGVVPSRRRWNDIERANFAFGYGISVTTLQLARAYSVFASGGIKRPISLLRKSEVEPGVRVIDEKITRQITEMLKKVASRHGTARRAQTDHYTVAGKTGTSHKVGARGYDAGRYMSIFAGFAPADDPRIVCVVVVNDPRGDQYYGGEVAAPVFSEIVSHSLRMLNVAPDKLTANSQLLAQGKGGASWK